LWTNRRLDIAGSYDNQVSFYSWNGSPNGGLAGDGGVLSNGGGNVLTFNYRAPATAGVWAISHLQDPSHDVWNDSGGALGGTVDGTAATARPSWTSRATLRSTSDPEDSAYCGQT